MAEEKAKEKGPRLQELFVKWTEKEFEEIRKYFANKKTLNRSEDQAAIKKSEK